MPFLTKVGLSRENTTTNGNREFGVVFCQGPQLLLGSSTKSLSWAVQCSAMLSCFII